MANAAVAQRNDNERDVPRMVRLAMDLRGVNQTGVCRVLGISQGPVSQRLNGQIEFRVGELLALADYLDVDVEFFFQPPSRVTALRATGGSASPCFWTIPAPDGQMELALGLGQPSLEVARHAA